MRAIYTRMPQPPTLAQLLEKGFTLDVVRFTDAPLNEGDVLLYTNHVTGRLLVARAPLLLQSIRTEASV